MTFLTLACASGPESSVTGSIALAVTSTNASFAVDTWRVTISGASGTQVKDGAPGTSVTFSDLRPGPYTVVLEGLEGGAVTQRGQTTATVVAGSTTQAVVSPAPVPPTVTIEPTVPAASEIGPVPGVVTVRRTGSTAGSLVVTLSAGGTASLGSDYSFTGPSVTIPAGQASATVTVTPVLDAVDEGSETVILTVQPGGHQVGTPSSATVTIADAPVVTVVATDPDASEVGQSTGTFTLSRTGQTGSSLVVAVSITGSATPGLDYSAPTFPVTIPAGQSSALWTVTPVADALVEGPETVSMTVIPLPPAAYAVGTPSFATITIADAPPPGPPTVTIVATDPNASEVGPDEGTFTISRTGPTTAGLAVNFVVGGTAQDGVDYRTPTSPVTGLASPITIPAGQQSVELVITPIPDALVEGDETAVVTIAASLAYIAGPPGSDTVTISDNVTNPVGVSLSTTNVSPLALAGGTANRLAPIGVTSTGQVLTGLTAGPAIYPGGGPTWVQSANLVSLTTPTTLQVIVIPVQLTPGQYSAKIPVNAPGAASDTLRVLLTVLPAPAGTLVFERGMTTNSTEVWKSAPNGTLASQLTANDSYDGRPAISPDGSKIAFRSERSGNSDIWTMALDGSNPVQWTNTSSELESYPAWIGSSFLVFSAAFGADQVLKLRTVGVVACPVCPTDKPAPALGFVQAWPAAAPAAVVAFGTNHWLGGGNIFEIWTWNWVTDIYTNLTQSNSADDRLPAFSPDGSKIAFTAMRGNSAYQIFVMNANGTGVQQLTSLGVNSQPTWSPDGSQIAFVTDRDGNLEIYLMNADGTSQVNSTNTPTTAEARPSWR